MQSIFRIIVMFIDVCIIIFIIFWIGVSLESPTWRIIILILKDILPPLILAIFLTIGLIVDHFLSKKKKSPR